MSWFPGHMSSFANRIGRAAPLTRKETQGLEELTGASQALFARNQMLLQAEAPLLKAYILLSGWAMWHEELPDGSRQIFDFILPGDIVGLTAMALERQYRIRKADPTPVRSAISVTALTQVEAAPVDVAAIDRLFAHYPELGALLLALTAAQRSASMRRRLMNVGRRSARARLAALLLELWDRQREAGLAEGQELELPVTQATLSDSIGISYVHMSRTVTLLQREGLISLTSTPDRKVVFHDLEALRTIAESGRGDATNLA